MSRYTPKRLPQSAGGGPARPRKSSAVGAKKTVKKAVPKKTRRGAYKCSVCEKGFNTEEALATHAADAHGKPVDPSTMSPLKANMTRCPHCGAPMRKRNLERHLQLVHSE
jgi:DNA-directed RNA polymerase subunit RPC12/RpoP